jgi:hypothetical protein
MEMKPSRVSRELGAIIATRLPGLKSNRALPIAQGNSGLGFTEINALARVARELWVERLVLSILLEQDHGEQARPAESRGSTWNGAGGCLDFPALPAGELLACVLDQLFSA